MDAVLKTIGTIVLSAIIVAIPMLCGLSFALDWYPSIKFLSVMGTSGVFIFVTITIVDKAV